MTQLDERPFTRRDALKRGALLGGTVLWVAPAVQSIGISSASAQTASPTGPSCTGKASDVSIAFSGDVTGQVGPFKESDESAHHPLDCAAGPFTATVPGTGAPLGTIGGFNCVENDFDTSGTCTTTHSISETSTINLNAVGIPLLIEVDDVTTSATASCGASPTTSVTIGSLTVSGPSGPVVTTPAFSVTEDTVVLDLSTIGVPGLEGTITLHDTNTYPDGIQVDAVHVFASLVIPETDVTPAVSQAVDVRFSHAEVGVVGCP